MAHKKQLELRKHRPILKNKRGGSKKRQTNGTIKECVNAPIADGTHHHHAYYSMKYYPLEYAKHSKKRGVIKNGKNEKKRRIELEWCC